MFPTADTEDISQVTSQSSSSSVPRDAQKSPEDTQVAKQNSNRELTLKMLLKEFVICMALSVATYAALHQSPTKISKHPQATRFFSANSIVTDWYQGQLSQAMAAVNRADVSFVMYYAPWDAESQYVRQEFEKAADVLNDRVFFAAINCWNPGSECRQLHNKIPSWPILMVYTVTSKGVLYKGPTDAQSMVRFLELIMKPLERISSTEDLVNLLSVCDALAVGFTPVSETSKLYNVWYNVALKVREFDHIGEICFGVVTSDELAVDLGISLVPNARLMLWNDTKDYIFEGTTNTWNETSLMQWVLENFAQPVARIMPLWKKAFSFERYVDGNPILVMFTPLNPLYEQLPAYALLREVAMEYYNCKQNRTSQWTTELTKLQQIQRLLYQQKNFSKFCQQYKFKKPVIKLSTYKKGIVSQNNKYPWSNTTQKNQKNVVSSIVNQALDISKVIGSTEENVQHLSSLGLIQECGMKVLPAEKSFYDFSDDKCQTIEDLEVEQDNDVNEIETTMLPLDDDPLASENLLQENVKHFCELYKFAQQHSPEVLPAKVHKNNITQISGLACKTNYTMHILAVDSVRNHHFAESLGINIVEKKDMTAVVILDSKHESQYVMSEEFSAKTIREFISNFTQKRLKRTLRTHVAEATHTHYFTDNGNTDINSTLCELTDLTTRTFRKFVRSPGAIKLIACCSGGCAAHVPRAMLACARVLRAGGVRVHVARLDVRAHDLRYHAAPHAMPTVLVYTDARGGEPDSISYPRHVRLTSGGLVALALRALGTPVHLTVRLTLCEHHTVNTEKKTCLRDIKEHVVTIIGRNLKYWRRTENKQLRDAIFKRLRDLHQISLDLSILHVTDLHKDNRKQIKILDSLSNLSRNWDIDVSKLNKNCSSVSKS